MSTGSSHQHRLFCVCDLREPGRQSPDVQYIVDPRVDSTFRPGVIGSSSSRTVVQTNKQSHEASPAKLTGTLLKVTRAVWWLAMMPFCRPFRRNVQLHTSRNSRANRNSFYVSDPSFNLTYVHPWLVLFAVSEQTHTDQRIIANPGQH